MIEQEIIKLRKKGKIKEAEYLEQGKNKIEYFWDFSFPLYLWYKHRVSFWIFMVLMVMVIFVS